MSISVAFLFVSFCYFTNETVFGLLSFENEKNDSQLKLHSIGGRKIRLIRDANASANLCPSGWTQVGASCYNRPNLTMNFTDSVNYCAANNSTLPIFYNASEYLSFENWWNTITNNTEVWLGITYDPASKQWLWLNNCTWKNFPAFWRTPWYKDSLSSTVYYAKYSNKINPPHAPTGVEPILNNLNTKLDVVCCQPSDKSTSGCYEFPFEKNSSFLCNAEGWWCATEHSLGQTVSTAVASDSCFCLDYNNVSLSSAEGLCNNINGTLADFRSGDEIQMITTLINNITLNEAIQDFMCPLGFSYFNDSCFTVLKPGQPIYSPYPGINADQYCRNNLSAQSASLHSFDEQWFLYHLYLTTMGVNCGSDAMYLGAYKNDTTVNFTYKWNDGSPMDYIPEWGLYLFNTPENIYYSALGVDIAIKPCDGKIGDNYITGTYTFACKSQILNYPVYPILVSSQNLLSKNKTFSPANPDQNVISKLCRKDRTLATSTTSTTTVTETPSISKANMCQNGWMQIGSSCYYRPNLTMNFNDSVNYCAANDSTLPIFYNASEYLSFQTWWNTITNNTEVWLGITYDPTSKQWLWLNNCTWKNFPAFWRTPWYKDSLTSTVYYAKYSNKINSQYAPTGVEPVLNNLNTKLDVVCYQPGDESTSGCYEFPFEKNSSFLCNVEGWWCATEHPLGQTVSTAVASDSCFCLDYNNVSLSSAEGLCNNINGTLADFRSDDELQMIVTLINNITLNEAIQDFMCPLGFSYFNDSCFTVLKPHSPIYSSYPGVNADQYCQNNLSAQSASLHSFDEQWFLYHLYLTTMGVNCGSDVMFLGAFKNDSQANFTYKWNDGSPMDYIPEWGLHMFGQKENNNYATTGVDIYICPCDGKIGDGDGTGTFSFACKSQILNYPVYPILVSSQNLLSKNKTFSPANSAQNVISKLCRKDRMLASSTTSTTTVTETSSIIKANMCQNGWMQIGSSCYYRPNLTMNFNDSVNYCAANDSTLPIFYNASEYLSFQTWWNTITNNTEVWLGITYDPTSKQWLWLNNCTWKNFPAFWRTPWYKDSLTSTVYYAKYSNKINSQYAPTGVEPVLNNLNTKLDVVCCQPSDKSTSGCYEFPFEKNSNFLCNTEGWWCATEHSLGQTVSTAVASDSCFCLDYNNVSLSFAEGSCNHINGTLADFRSDDELQMIVTLINNITLNEAIQDFMCPLGFSYFNGSCFTVLKPGQPIYSPYPGVNADQYCRNNLSAQSVSLHSFDEQWFLYHLYLTTMGVNCGGDIMYLGAFKNDTNANFTYKWNDGSPMDYIPEWGLHLFDLLENTDYTNTGIDIFICPCDGKIGDRADTGTFPFACKSQILNYPVYPILVSSQNLLNKNKTFSPANPAQSVISKLCRKDRAVAPSTTSTTTVQGTSLATSINTSLQSTTSLTMQSTVENVPTTTSPNESPVNPMSVTEQLMAKVISTIGCTWIAVTTTLSFVTGAFLSRKSYSFEQKLRMIEEFLLCLAHILIATLTSHFDEKIVCSLTSLALQYIFTSFFMFLMIESLQTYCIYTNVISSGQCLPTKVVVLLGLVIPGLFVLPVAIFGFKRLSSSFSCFVNYDDVVCLGNVLPILLICIISIVTTESNGMHLFEDLPLTCIFQRHSAIVSKHALFFKIPLTISSWVLMTVGLHYKKFYWFVCIFGVNVALGWVCFLSHFIGNEEVKVKRLFHKLVKKKI